MNQKLFYVLLAIIGVSSALPVEQEHGDTNDLSVDDYVPAENAELAEEELSYRKKRQADRFRYHDKFNLDSIPPSLSQKVNDMNIRSAVTPRPDPQTFVNGVGGGNFHSRQNWDANVALQAGAKVWESANQRHSVGVHGSYGQAAGSYQGYRYQSPPQWGAGASYIYRFPG